MRGTDELPIGRIYGFAESSASSRLFMKRRPKISFRLFSIMRQRYVICGDTKWCINQYMYILGSLSFPTAHRAETATCSKFFHNFFNISSIMALQMREVLL